MKGLNQDYVNKEIIDLFESLKNSLLSLQNDSYAVESLKSFCIISWLESKIKNSSLEEIIVDKASKNEIL